MDTREADSPTSVPDDQAPSCGTARCVVEERTLQPLQEQSADGVQPSERERERDIEREREEKMEVHIYIYIHHMNICICFDSYIHAYIHMYIDNTCT